jgi:mRNA-degrading endonuclease YafQ of YafQ-DinJ toxin-antitoxin module
MPIRRTKRFKRAFLKLSKPIREKVKHTLALLDQDFHHPGLRAKRLSGYKDIFYARVDRNHRLTYERRGDVLILRNVGRHDETLENP